jgi:hypothetical protein
MLKTVTSYRWAGRKAAAWLLVMLIASTGLAGCGTVSFQTGKHFNPGVLEGSLKTGVSTQADLKRLLGEPYGKGRALMPFHPSDRTVWTYYYEQGSVDMGSGKIKDQRLYLFVFLDGDRFDGYMWFDSQLN